MANYIELLSAYDRLEVERDQLRELCGELLNEIKTAVVYAENNIGAIDHLKSAITKAEKALGGNDGTNNCCFGYCWVVWNWKVIPVFNGFSWRR